jgi:hypothetical protein
VARIKKLLHIVNMFPSRDNFVKLILLLALLFAYVQLKHFLISALALRDVLIDHAIMDNCKITVPQII